VLRYISEPGEEEDHLQCCDEGECCDGLTAMATSCPWQLPLHPLRLCARPSSPSPRRCCCQAAGAPPGARRGRGEALPVSQARRAGQQEQL
jgi:hypothetical protein